MTETAKNNKDKDLSKSESNGLPASGISQDYLHKIVSEARKKFNIPAIAILRKQKTDKYPICLLGSLEGCPRMHFRTSS